MVTKGTELSTMSISAADTNGGGNTRDSDNDEFADEEFEEVVAVSFTGNDNPTTSPHSSTESTAQHHRLYVSKLSSFSGARAVFSSNNSVDVGERELVSKGKEHATDNCKGEGSF